MTYTIETDQGKIHLKITGKLKNDDYSPFIDTVAKTIEEATNKRVQGDKSVLLRVYKGTKRSSTKGCRHGHIRKAEIMERLKKGE